MKILVTGAAGFVGTNLVRHMMGRGHQAIGLDSLVRRGVEANLQELQEEFPKFEFRQREVEDMPSEIMRAKPDVVYHLAAQVAVTTSSQSPTRDFDINARGTFLVAKAANDIGAKIVYTSTNKVFGAGVNNVPIVEEETRYDFGGPLAKKGIPENFSIDATHHTPYGVSKLVGDLYVREFGGVSNRCSCMYGKNQFGIVDQGWISHIAQRIISGQQVVIYGDGKQLRDALNAADLVRLLEMEGEALLNDRPRIGGEAFSIGGGYENTVSLLELCDRWGLRKEDLQFAQWRPADQKVFYCDTSKANNLLRWQPRVGLDQGLSEIYEWTRKKLSA